MTDIPVRGGRRAALAAMHLAAHIHLKRDFENINARDFQTLGGKKLTSKQQTEVFVLRFLIQGMVLEDVQGMLKVSVVLLSASQFAKTVMQVEKLVFKHEKLLRLLWDRAYDKYADAPGDPTEDEGDS